MIRRWLHNRKYPDTPMCPCKWRMMPVENQFHDTWSNPDFKGIKELFNEQSNEALKELEKNHIMELEEKKGTMKRAEEEFLQLTSSHQ